MVCNAALPEPEPIMAGCYYGMLNVLDPSIAYDSTGKVVGVLKLPTSENAPTETQTETAERNPTENNEQEVTTYFEESDEVRQAECQAARGEVKDDLVSTNEPPVKGNYKTWVEDYLSKNDILKQLSSEGGGDLQVRDKNEDGSYLRTETEKSENPPEAEESSQDCQDWSQTEAKLEQTSWFSWSQPKQDEPIAEVPTSEEKASDIAHTSITGEDTPHPETKPSSWFSWGVSDTINNEDNGKDSTPTLDSDRKRDADPSTLFSALPKSDPSSQEDETLHSLEPEPVELVEHYGDSTPLFKTMERKNWQAVLFFLRTGSYSFNPILGNTDVDTVVDHHVKTWVSKKDIVGNEMWRLLPLHAAVCFGAPQKVLENLLQVYPDALKKPDGHGNLPLHLAFIFNADDDVTAFLMRSFPASIHVMNNEGLMPIQCSSDVASETFQSKAELFDALSDYTRAVAENAPDKLVEQLEDVRRQLKAVNETLFANAPPRKEEPIKRHINTLVRNATATAAASASKEGFDPVSAFAGAGLGLCALGPARQALTDGSEQLSKEESAIKEFTKEESLKKGVDSVGLSSENDLHGAGKSTKQERQRPMIPQVACRVKEYCPETKTWREV